MKSSRKSSRERGRVDRAADDYITHLLAKLLPYLMLLFSSLRAIRPARIEVLSAIVVRVRSFSVPCSFLVTLLIA